jgi:catechol 2,3-dioxygenase-like lactoylglutathione lyase family enzyme
MCAARLLQTHPIVGSRDLDRTIAFYGERLGFEMTFEDGQTPRNYVGMRRDDVELHFQFQYEHEMGTIRLRFLVSDPDGLLADFQSRHAFSSPPSATQVALTESIRDTAWGTREFGFYDSDGNELHFYCDLR